MLTTRAEWHVATFWVAGRDCFVLSVDTEGPRCGGPWDTHGRPLSERAESVDWSSSAEVRATRLTQRGLLLFCIHGICWHFMFSSQAGELCHSFPSRPVETLRSRSGCRTICARRCCLGWRSPLELVLKWQHVEDVTDSQPAVGSQLYIAVCSQPNITRGVLENRLRWFKYWEAIPQIETNPSKFCFYNV